MIGWASSFFNTQIMNYNEIYIGKKDKEYIKSRITSIGKNLHQQGVGYKQQRALFRDYCLKVLDLFEECFETSLLGMSRCVRKVMAFQSDDNVDIKRATLEIADILMWLLGVVERMIPWQELPSCKKLSELSGEDIVAKAKNLVESVIVKAGIGAVLFGLKMGEVIRIEDVRRYYEVQLKALRGEIEEKGTSPSLAEQFLIDKFNAEIGYCYRAIWKAGIGAVEEIKDLVEIGQRNIDKYERQLNEGVGCWSVNTGGGSH